MGNFRLFRPLHAARRDGHAVDRAVGRDVVHHVHQQTLHYRAQAARADLALDGLVGNRFERLGLERELSVVVRKQLLILLDERVFRLGQDLDKVVARQRVERRDDRQSADQLGDDAELQDIVRLHLA